MKSKPELIVIDTCVYVDALYTGHARAKEVDEDRVARSGSLLETVNRGEFLAGLLPMVLVEINSSQQLGPHLEPKMRSARRGAIDAYFGGVGHVTLEHDDRVAQLGAKLARQEQMKGPDALVVASAVVHEAFALFSWDKKILGLKENPLVRGLHIKEPPKKVHPKQVPIFDWIPANGGVVEAIVKGLKNGNP